MQIAKNTVVTLSYRVTDSDGSLVDEGAQPLVYLHGGYDGIFPLHRGGTAGQGRSAMCSKSSCSRRMHSATTTPSWS